MPPPAAFSYTPLFPLGPDSTPWRRLKLDGLSVAECAAIVFGKKGQRVWVEGDEEEAISRGVHRTYTETNLRYSQVAPPTMFEGINTGTNLPVQFDIAAAPGERHAKEFELTFVAKGGGSANKSFLFQETQAILTPEKLAAWIETKVRTLGTSACPPYHLVLVIGGTGAETTLKLASTRWLDALPTAGSADGHVFRDVDMERQVLETTCRIGVGAQFGGKYFCHDVRVIRLPCHGASLPAGLGMSCSADRQIRARIGVDVVFLEQLETEPHRFLPDAVGFEGEVARVDLNRPMLEIRRRLPQRPVKTHLALSGTVVAARDIAHARPKQRLDDGRGLPEYFKNHPVYYAGPAKTPEGFATGSFGPTTAGRLAKGDRSRAVRDACRAHGGFYLGSVGGAAARLAQDCIRHVEALEYAELGMEAAWRIEVEDFPAFIVIDDKGRDFYDELG